jgi:hypothetical protein
MSSEQDVPEVQAHQGPLAQPAQMDGQMGGRNGDMGSAQEAGHGIPHGMGQSKSSRRRRRKRKNKSPEEAQQGVQGGAAQFTGAIQANGQGGAARAGIKNFASATGSARRRILAIRPAQADTPTEMAQAIATRIRISPATAWAVSSVKEPSSGTAARAPLSVPWITVIAWPMATSQIRLLRPSSRMATIRAEAAADADTSAILSRSTTQWAGRFRFR